MQQPLPSRLPEVSLSIPSLTPGIGPGSARELHVLLRIPDCSQRVRVAAADPGTGKLLGIGWADECVRKVLGLFARLWRSRKLLVGAASVGLVLITVAMVAAARQRGTNHAGSSLRGEAATASSWTVTSDSPATTSNSGTVSASILGDAPPFMPSGDVNQVPPSQRSTVGEAPPYRPRGTASSTTAARAPAGPQAHIPQRIDRVPAQY